MPPETASATGSSRDQTLPSWSVRRNLDFNSLSDIGLDEKQQATHRTTHCIHDQVGNLWRAVRHEGLVEFVGNSIQKSTQKPPQKGFTQMPLMMKRSQGASEEKTKPRVQDEVTDLVDEGKNRKRDVGSAGEEEKEGRITDGRQPVKKD